MASRKNANGKTKKQLEKKLAGYSAAAGAAIAVGAVGGVTDRVEATIIHTDHTAAPIDVFLGSTYLLDFATLGAATDLKFIIASFSGGSSNLSSPIYVFTYQAKSAYVTGPNGASIATFAGSAKLLPGASSFINAALFSFSANTSATLAFNYSYNSHYGTATAFTAIYAGSSDGGAFLDTRGFLGVQFQIGGNTHFGWVDLEVDAILGATRIYGWAYESFADTQIKVGATSTAVPEPGTLATLALGAAGVLAWRRRGEKGEGEQGSERCKRLQLTQR